jgi:hypothetical protein
MLSWWGRVGRIGASIAAAAIRCLTHIISAAWEQGGKGEDGKYCRA